MRAGRVRIGAGRVGFVLRGVGLVRIFSFLLFSCSLSLLLLAPAVREMVSMFSSWVEGTDCV